jgi:hypothetical protein
VVMKITKVCKILGSYKGAGKDSSVMGYDSLSVHSVILQKAGIF